MAGKKQDLKNDKRNTKNEKKGFSAKLIKIGKSLKSFVVNLKSELKRVVWPDRKKLRNNTATVLAICVLASILLFLVDSIFGGILEGIGFYTPNS